MDNEATEVANGTESAAEDAAEQRSGALKSRYSTKKPDVTSKGRSMHLRSKMPRVSYSKGSRTPSATMPAAKPTK